MTISSGAEMTHRCHAIGCTVEVDPGLLCCKPHWFMIPKPLRQRVWKAYRKGQEINKDPTPEYLAAAKAAIAAVAEREGRQASLFGETANA
jgi:hypothetical protein